MSFGEIIVILVVALVVLPPKQLPKAAQQLGRFVFQINSLWQELRFTVLGYLKSLEAEAQLKDKAEKESKPE